MEPNGTKWKHYLTCKSRNRQSQPRIDDRPILQLARRGDSRDSRLFEGLDLWSKNTSSQLPSRQVWSGSAFAAPQSNLAKSRDFAQRHVQELGFPVELFDAFVRQALEALEETD